jgi:hypothetical protein
VLKMRSGPVSRKAKKISLEPERVRPTMERMDESDGPALFASTANAGPRSTFCSRHSSAFFRAWFKSLGRGGEAGFIYAHMTDRNLYQMLTQLYLELGLPLPDALRAVEADLKDNSPPSYSASEMGPFLGRESPFSNQDLFQYTEPIVRALIASPAGA